MCDKFKLDDCGNCLACNKLSSQTEHVQCFACKNLFHGICNNATADEKIATKTMVNSFLLSSTKNNFLFFCDKCLTQLEISSSGSDSQRINLLETKMNTIDTQLQEITSMLKSNASKPATPAIPRHAAPPPPSRDNIWFNPDKLATVKAPSPKAVLVVSKNPDQKVNTENQIVVEKAVVENQIRLDETYTNQSGDLILICNSVEERDELKMLVHNAKEDISMNSPKVKHQSITIVGLVREYSTVEIKQLILQNEFINKFSAVNKLEEHFKIYSVKPLKNNAERFQVFASVSQILREGIRNLKNDKLVMGVSSCKVYDRTQTKRCNNCQMFGHYMANCPTPNVHNCGKCSGNHFTKDCTSTERGCINCKRNSIHHSPHDAFYHKCPSLIKFQELLQQSQENVNLNSQRLRKSLLR